MRSEAIVMDLFTITYTLLSIQNQQCKLRLCHMYRNKDQAAFTPTLLAQQCDALTYYMMFNTDKYKL